MVAHGTSVIGAAALLFVSATAMAAPPAVLTDRQLDQVTAGLSVNEGSAAAAAGSTVALTETYGGSIGTTNSLPGGGYVENGVAGGTAAADAPGGSAATAANSSGSVNGNTLLSTGIHGTVAGAGASVSVGFTFVTDGSQ